MIDSSPQVVYRKGTERQSMENTKAKRVFLSEETWKEIRTLYTAKGWKTKQIADHFGVSTVTVNKRLKKMGVEMKGPSSNKRLLSEKEKAQIINLYVELKKPIKDVASELEICSLVLGRFLKESGLTRCVGEVRRQDLTGMRFGKLVVTSESAKPQGSNSRQKYYQCSCDCGSTRVVVAGSLVSGNTKSCGCFMREELSRKRTHDLTGQRFGSLVVTARVLDEKKNQTRWTCDCDCGNKTIAHASHLKAGSRVSCGCLLGGWDSIGAFLDGSFRNAKADSEFYLYGLANHALIKAGIDSTGNRADEEYGEQLLAIELPRFEAWLLEQAFLKETARLAVTPVGLCEWAGRSEIRDIQESAAIDLAVQLHDQLLGLGPKDFAIQFIPTTPVQREVLATMAA